MPTDTNSQRLGKIVRNRGSHVMWGLPGWKIQRIREKDHGSLPYPDSEESEDDIVDTEECENELQLINLRNEVTHQITVDTCGERCAQLDDFNWVRPTDEWNEESDTPESEMDTPTAEMVFIGTPRTRLHQRGERRHSSCRAPRWSLE